MAQRFQDRPVRDRSQCNDDARTRQARQFVHKECIARIDFSRDRLVTGRKAAHCIGDAAIPQLKTIVNASADWMI